MAKFEVGEEVFSQGCASQRIGPDTNLPPEVVTVTKVLSSPPDSPKGYRPEVGQWYEINDAWFVHERRLRKKPKPGEQDSVRGFDSLIRWCNKFTPKKATEKA